MTMNSSSGARRACFPLVAIAALILLAAPPRPAYAQQSITCTPSATTVNFGPYDILSGLTVAAVGSFTVTCISTGGGVNRTVTYRVTIPPPGTTARQMKPPSPPDVITYTLYTDAARTIVWGDGTGGTTPITGTLFVRRNGTPATSAAINYYGLITPGGQDVSAASPGPPPTTYSQSLTVTVTCTPVPPC